MRRSAVLPAAALSIALGFFGGSALADEPSPAERKAAAQALFDEARSLTAAGKFAEACPKFAESARLDPTTGTKFYLADCFEHVGKLASAWTYYLEVADAALAAGQKDREKFARERAEAMKPRLTRLSITVPDAVRGLAGLEVKRDGVALGEAQWQTAIPVDAGHHAVTAVARGKKPWETGVDATEEGKTLTVEIPPLEDAVATPPVKPPPVAPPKPPIATPPPIAPQTGGMPPQRIAGIAAGAAGVIGLGVGTAFGVIAVGKKSDSNDGHCDAQSFCDSTGLQLRKDAISAATISTVAFVAGTVALGAGVVLVLTSRSTPAQPAAALSVGPGSISISGRF